MKNTILNIKIMQTAYVYTRHVHLSFSILYYKLLNIFYLLQTVVWSICSITFIQVLYPWYKPQTPQFFTFIKTYYYFLKCTMHKQCIVFYIRIGDITFTGRPKKPLTGRTGVS